MYQICNENTIYETANDKLEIKLWDMRATLFMAAKRNFELDFNKCLKKSFEVILESMHILNCDTDASSE